MVSRLAQSDGTTNLATDLLLRLLWMTLVRPETVAWGCVPPHSDEASWPSADAEEQFAHSVLRYPQFPHTALCYTLDYFNTLSNSGAQYVIFLFAKVL
jgi:hypothetical protein